MFQPASEFLPMIDEVCNCLLQQQYMISCYLPFCVRKILISLYMFEQVLKSLIEITKEIKGAYVENNKFCVSVHYRNVDEKVRVVLSSTIQPP